MTFRKSDLGIANPLTLLHIDKMSPEVSFDLHTSKIFIKWGTIIEKNAKSLYNFLIPLNFYSRSIHSNYNYVVVS